MELDATDPGELITLSHASRKVGVARRGKWKEREVNSGRESEKSLAFAITTRSLRRLTASVS